ncbi:3-oxoacid CoA-transferase subunit B [Vibrio sp. CDRSL-10 TSBA]
MVEQLSVQQLSSLGLTRNQMAWRAAQDIEDGSYVNLGIGIPEKVAEFVEKGKTVCYHTENGILGFGPTPEEEACDPELINAGKRPVSMIPGCSFFNQADSFAMMRGGHINRCFLGAMQVSARGDLANWITNDPNAIPAVGGAMDLVAGVKNIGVLTEHVTRDGQPKLVAQCSYPLTGIGVITRIYTNLAVIDTSVNGFIVREIVEGLSVEQLQQFTGAPLLLPEEGVKTLFTPEL